MSHRAYVFFIALLLAGCTAPATKSPSRLSQNETRIAEAIKEALGGMYAGWDGPLTLDDVEKKKGDPFSEVAVQSTEWIEFKAQYRAGDEIYYVSTSSESWEMLMGRAGYVLVRGDLGIRFYCTVLN